MEVDSDELILLVQRHKCLYDPRCEKFNDRHCKVYAWLDICKYLAAEDWDALSDKEKYLFGTRVQRHWKILKHSYRDSLIRSQKKAGKRKNRSGSSYVFDREMSFLKEVLMPGSVSKQTTPPEGEAGEPSEKSKSETATSSRLSPPSETTELPAIKMGRRRARARRHRETPEMKRERETTELFCSLWEDISLYRRS